jgi:hypothetical protein
MGSACNGVLVEESATAESIEMKTYYTERQGIVPSENIAAYAQNTGMDAWEAIYLAADADALIAQLKRELGETNEALAACQGQARRRIAQLEQRIFDCESALLLRHHKALAEYAGKYPEPMAKSLMGR